MRHYVNGKILGKRHLLLRYGKVEKRLIKFIGNEGGQKKRFTVFELNK